MTAALIIAALILIVIEAGDALADWAARAVDGRARDDRSTSHPKGK